MEQSSIETLKKIAYITVGVLTPENGTFSEMVNEWIDKGKMTEKEGEKFVKDIYEKAGTIKEDIEKSIKEHSADVFEKLNIASLEKINELEARIEALEKKK